MTTASGRRTALGLFALVLAAAWLRLHGLDWDQGHHLHPDERFLTMVETAIELPGSVGEYLDTARSPLNPANRGHSYFVYGTLPLFMVRVLAAAFGLEGYDQVYLLGRAVAGLLDCGTVLLAFRIGWILAGPEVALAAAALLTFSTFSIQQAHFFTVDSFACFFATLALLAMVRAAIRGTVTSHALFGIAFGLTLACRVNLVLLAPFYGLALLHSWWTGRTSLRKAVAAGAIAALATAIVFRLAQPYAFVGPGFFGLRIAPEFFKSMETIRSYVIGVAESPPSVQWIGRTPVLFAGKNVFAWGLGPAWGLAAIAGLAWCIFRRRPAEGGERVALGRIAALWAAGLFLYHSSQFGATARYFLAIVPVLAIAAAWPLARPGRARVARRRVLAVVVALSAIWAIAFTAIYRRPHSRVEASRWIYENIPHGSVLGTEHWDDSLPIGLDGRSPHVYRFVELGLYAEDDAAKRKRLIEQLDEIDTIVLSSNRLYRSIPRTPWRFPLGRRYYEHLFSGALGFHLERVVTSYPRFGPFEIPDDEAEEAFTVYDHPKVLIFRKGKDYSRERVKALLEAVPLTGIVRVTPREASKIYRRVRPTDIALPGEQTVRTAVGSSGTGSVAASLRWLVAIEALSLAFFALIFRAMAATRDRGFGLAKVLAWLGPGYLGWLLCSVGLAPNSAGLMHLLAAAVVIAGGAAAWLERDALVEVWRRDRRAIGRVELVFLGAFSVFLAGRLLNPAIFWGEKPMDFAILNAITRSETMPPIDPWYAGEPLNYFYFGHALVAFFAKMAGVPTAFAFNLAIATLGGLLALAAYLVGDAIGRRAMAGILVALGIAIFGNLDGPRLLFDQPSRAIDFNYFWATSRVIEGTINEYPFWSMIFADLHAHVLALPLDLALVYLGALWAAGRGPGNLTLAVLMAWLLGAVAVTSSWSLPSTAAVQLGLLATAWRSRRGRLSGLLGIVLAWLAILGLSRVLFLPFWSAYRPPGEALPWGWETNRAPLGDVVTIFGGFLVAVVPALLLRTARRPLAGTIAVALALVAAIAAALFRSPAAGLFAGLSALALVLWWTEPDSDSFRIAALLVAAAGGLGFVTEVIFVWDRMNTVFKYYLQIWLLLGSAAGLLLSFSFDRIGRRTRLSWAAALLLAASAALFTSVSAAVGFVRSPHAASPLPTLDGMAYLGLRRAPELEAFRWLNREVPGVPVLLEAHGPSYQDFSRVSMNTGLPSVLGWEYHLFQQAHTWAQIEQRRDDVKTMFSSPDPAVAEPLLRKYHVDLVVVGRLERRTYPASGLAKLERSSLIQPVFRNSEVTIYATPGLLQTTKTWIDEVREPRPAPRAAPLQLLREPRDVATDRDGNLWIADFGNRRIQHRGAAGDVIAAFGLEGEAPGEFRDPCGIAVAPDGTVYVADTWNHRVQRFSPKGDVVGEWAPGFYGPRGIAVARDGSVYVSDTGNHRVVRFDPDGEPRVEWGRAGEREALKSPVGIAIAPSGDVYVADVGKRRVAVFSRDGRFLRDWPVDGWEAKALQEPHLDVGPDGTVWVADPSGNRVLLFDGEGRPLGTARSAQPLRVPVGIAVLDETRAAVTNAASNEVVVVDRLPATPD